LNNDITNMKMDRQIGDDFVEDTLKQMRRDADMT